MSAPQIWRLSLDGRDHRVETSTGVNRHVRWYVDDELVADKSDLSDKIQLSADVGRLEVRFGTLGGPRRATLADGGLGTDLVPEPGSKADAYERKLREHPERYAAIAAVGGVAKVVVPILLAVLATRFALSLPLPDLPSIPLPDLPSVPTPDLPGIPLPDLPDWEVPGWVPWTVDKVKYVWPIVLAYVLARAEIKRRREQDERRRADEGLFD